MAYGGLLALAVTVVCSAFRIGVQGIGWGIACWMFGLLVVARLLPNGDGLGSDWSEPLREVVRLRRFWVLVVASISINLRWHFLINWLPGYLTQVRRMGFLASGVWAALPFLATDLGNLGGGAQSRSLVGRGLGPSRARLRVMAGCSVLIASGGLVGWVRDDRLAVRLIGMMALGTAAFMANDFASCQDVSARHTGFVVGVLGGMGNLFVASFLPFAGYVKETSGSFGPDFVLAGLLPFVGLRALAIGWGADADPVENPGASTRSFG